MRSLKNHISLIIPLFAILFAIEFTFWIDRSIDSYEKNLSSDYAIVIMSKKPLTLQKIKEYVPEMVQLQEIDRKKVINRLKREGVKIDFSELEQFLPFFYKALLANFPDEEQLKSVQSRLASIPSVTRVEAFGKTHQQLYEFLVFIKTIAKLFLAIVAITSIMLIFKQIEIWYYEHSERMYIMSLFGAPWWMRNAVLFKLAFVDTLISVILVVGIYWYILSSEIVRNLLGFNLLYFDQKLLVQDGVILFAIGFGLSLFTILFISKREPKRAV